MLRLSLLLIMAAAIVPVHSQSYDTVFAGKGILKPAQLATGSSRYLVYLEKDGQKRNIWLWDRIVSRESFHDKPAIVVRQHWVTSDTGFNSRTLFTVADEKTFLPVYHASSNPKTGKESFDFSPAAITTSDSITDAGRKGFKQELSIPTYNWELDMETFASLPLKEGKTFVINFYHPGSSQKPQWYNYAVTGSEKLKLAGGDEVDCFKLHTEYANNRGNSTWWISKKTHEVLKMEENFGPVKRFKIKLAIN